MAQQIKVLAAMFETWIQYLALTWWKERTESSHKAALWLPHMYEYKQERSMLLAVDVIIVFILDSFTRMIN